MGTKRLLRIGAMSALLGSLAGCAGTTPQPLSATMLQKETVSGQLQEGRRIFTTSCTSCHAAQPVEAYSLAEWRLLITKMAPRARVSAEGQAALLAYIEAVHRP